MGLLDGGLQRVFGAAFGGVYLQGSLSRAQSKGRDEFGDQVDGTPASIPIRVQVDVYSDVVRAQAGIPQTDAKLLILQIGLTDKPRAGDKIILGRASYVVGDNVTADPANTHWTVQASLIT